MSRDSALVMCFYMRLEKHICNAMSIDLLFALAFVSFDHLRTSSHSFDICCSLALELWFHLRHWQRQQSDKGKINAWIFGVVAFKKKMSCMPSRAINIACARAMKSRHRVPANVFLYALRKTCTRCHVSWSVDTWIIRCVVSSLACSCNIRTWQRQPSVKGEIPSR